MGITEEIFAKVLELCVEIRQKYKKCLDRCLDNTALIGIECFELCREKVAEKYNLSIKTIKGCINIEKHG